MGVFTCSIFASIVTILVSTTVILTSIVTILISYEAIWKRFSVRIIFKSQFQSNDLPQA